MRARRALPYATARDRACEVTHGQSSAAYVADERQRGDTVSAAELEGAGETVPGDIDIHTTAGKLADFERRVQEATHAGSERAVEKQHAAGKMTARERIEALLDPGS